MISSTVVNALLPVVLTLLLGYVAGWHHDADVNVAAVLNRIVLTYALPLALFSGTVANSRAQLLEELPLALALLIGLVAPYVAVVLIARFVVNRDWAQSAMWGLMMGSPATSFTGLPVLTAVVGSRATVAVALAGIISNLVVIPSVILLINLQQAAAKGERQPSQSFVETLKQSLLQPVVIAPLFGIALVIFNIHVPGVATHAANLMGVSSAGLSLFASGIILQAQKPKLTIPVSVLSIMRTAVIPGVVLIVLWKLGLPRDVQRQAVLALGLPAGTMQVMLAVKYHVNEQENASLLLFSNVASLVTLAIFIGILH
jgi:malonate transporter